METVKSSWSWLVERWQVEDVVVNADNDYTWLIIVVAGLVFVAILFPPIWKYVKYSNTIFHEMGHVMAATVFRRKVSGIKVHDDTSGVTVSKGKPHGIGMIVTAFSGYPGSAFLATIMTLLLINNYAGAALTLYHTLLIFAFLLCRNLFGFISVLFTFLLTIGINIWNDPYAVSWTVIALIVFYSITGIRGTFGLFSVHFGHLNGGIRKAERIAMKDNKKDSDASQLFKLTLIPATIWVFVFIGINIFLTILNMYLIVFN